jgi:hypothetical protein
MKTRDLTTPKVGMTLFSKAAGLMVNVTRITEEGFNFFVMNGVWQGGVRGGEIVMYNVPTGERSSTPVMPIRGGFKADFVQVLEVTEKEFDDWYMHNTEYRIRVRDAESEHVTLDDEDPAGRILRAQIEKGLSTEALEAESRVFIEKKGLSDEYADHLEALTYEEECDDEGMEP